MAWVTIDVKPQFPIGVEMFYGDAQPLVDQHGNPATLPPYRDVRRELGYWDGETFCELGTGHSVFEDWREPGQRPTHYRVLDPPPP